MKRKEENSRVMERHHPVFMLVIRAGSNGALEQQLHAGAGEVVAIRGRFLQQRYQLRRPPR